MLESLRSTKKRNDSFHKIIQHKIYDTLLLLLENRRIGISESNTTTITLHYKTKQVLYEKYRLTKIEVKSIEKTDNHESRYAKRGELVQDAPVSLYTELKKVNKTEMVAENRIVAIPNFIENACICEYLARKFSRGEILSCNGFKEVFGKDENSEVFSTIRLDIDERYRRSGFIIPVLSIGGKGLIESLKIFRYPNDERPFILRTRNYNKEEKGR